MHCVVKVDDRLLRHRREEQVVRLELTLYHLLQAAHLTRQLAKVGRTAEDRKKLRGNRHAKAVESLREVRLDARRLGGVRLVRGGSPDLIRPVDEVQRAPLRNAGQERKLVRGRPA